MLLNLMFNTAVLPGADIILDMHQVTFDFSSFTQEQKEPRDPSNFKMKLEGWGWKFAFVGFPSLC